MLKMKTHVKAISTLLLMVSLIQVQAQSVESQTARNLIVPGLSVGDIYIGYYIQDIITAWGAPSNYEYLDGRIYARYDNSGLEFICNSSTKQVTCVIVKNAFYKDKYGVGYASYFKDVERNYGKGVNEGDNFMSYDKYGIAFKYNNNGYVEYVSVYDLSYKAVKTTN